MARVFVTASDVARLLDVRPSAVSNWTARGSGPLPAPAAYAAGRPLWTLTDVRAVLDARHADALAYLETLAPDVRLTPADIPADFPVRPLPLDADTDAAGVAVCGTCGLAWNDALVTGWTPAPAGRCPFEPFHLDADGDE